LEEIAKTEFPVIRNWGIFYMYLSKPVWENLGIDGERAIRKGLRAWAKWRGEGMRKVHMEEGLGPMNLESVRRFWLSVPVRAMGLGPARAKKFSPAVEDIMSRARAQPVTPYFHKSIAPNCPIYDVFKEANWWHGWAFCDATHIECLQGYVPEAVVEIHECLTKGDDFCNFWWIMTPTIPDEQIDRSAIEAKDNMEKANPVKTFLYYLNRDVEWTGALYYFLADALVKRFGEEGKRVVKSSLIDIGRRRGKEVKEKLVNAGLAVTWKNIFDNFDLPYKHVWKMNVETSNDRFEADVEHCPLAEVWNTLENKELGPMYCETMYASMFKELLGEETKVEIPQCKTKGASKCRFEFKT
jgi:predicted hydrocarbon binding protein